MAVGPRLLAGLLLMASDPALAGGVALCGANQVPIEVDGRLLNHFAYAAGPRADLVRAPRGFGGQCGLVNREMRGDLEALLDRARADPVGRYLVALSCFRSPQHQARIFCNYARGSSLFEQALEIAPPGHSEHVTGFAIDFGERRGRCKLTACFAETAVGRWLARNAPDFGFEMSFPQGNSQGVAFEPWHWRWVGRGANGTPVNPVFAVARERFPAASASVREASWPREPSPFAALTARRIGSEIAWYAAQRPQSSPASFAPSDASDFASFGPNWPWPTREHPIFMYDNKESHVEKP